MKKIIITIILLLIYTFTYSQSSITGTFTNLANQNISLIGFNGFETYVIESSQASGNGVFNLSYIEKDIGMGYLKAEDEKPFFVVLSGENIQLIGDSFAVAENIKILEGRENQLFGQYATEHPRREQILSAWDYLEKVYTLDTLFSKHESSLQSIIKEKQRVKNEDNLFLEKLPKNSFAIYYLPLRKLVSSVATIAQYRPEDIPTSITAFRKIDYIDSRLQKTGLLADAIESHVWLIENSGRSLDSVHIEMKKSIDILVENLLSDNQKLNQITEHLFQFLEKRSLQNASEYLALKLLNVKNLKINPDFAAQLEGYRTMKKGNIAPDFKFRKDVIANGYEASKKPKKLSDLTSNYTVVVFGSSWCPECPKELYQISGLYKKWKEQGVEVVFVSLDEHEKLFKSFASIFPFISISDYQKWESPIVKSYHVFATPTIYLLNGKREILLRPNSVDQLDSWVEWYLVKGNK